MKHFITLTIVLLSTSILADHEGIYCGKKVGLDGDSYKFEAVYGQWDDRRATDIKHSSEYYADRFFYVHRFELNKKQRHLVNNLRSSTLVCVSAQWDGFGGIAYDDEIEADGVYQINYCTTMLKSLESDQACNN